MNDITPPDPRLTLAWAMRDDIPADQARRRWLMLCAALAHWPGPPVAVERRLVVPGARALTAEILLVSVDGAGIVGSADELLRDASHLVRPLLADRDLVPLLTPDALHAAGGAHTRGDVVEAPVADAPCPRSSDALRAVLAALADSCSAATTSIVVAPPPATHEVRIGAAGPAVRCTLRVSAVDRLPNAALAHAAVMAGLTAAGWRRPSKSSVGVAHTTPTSLDGDLVVCQPATAGELLGLRVPTAASDAGRGHLRWPDRRDPVAVLGDVLTRVPFLTRLVLADLRAGRRVTVIDAEGELSSALRLEGTRSGGLTLLDVRPCANQRAAALQAAHAGSASGSCVLVNGIRQFSPAALRMLFRLCGDRRVALTLADEASRGRAYGTLELGCSTVIKLPRDIDRASSATIARRCPPARGSAVDGP